MFLGGFTWTTNALTVIYAEKPLLLILSAMMTKGTPLFTSSQKQLRKSIFASRPWRVVPWKLLETSGNKKGCVFMVYSETTKGWKGVVVPQSLEGMEGEGKPRTCWWPHVVAEWRGYSERPVRPIGAYRTMREILKAFLQRLGLSERSVEGMVLEAWKETAGEFFARYSTPVRLKAGVLHVRVHQPSIRYELDRTWKPQLLARLQGRFGKNKPVTST